MKLTLVKKKTNVAHNRPATINVGLNRFSYLNKSAERLGLVDGAKINLGQDENLDWYIQLDKKGEVDIKKSGDVLGIFNADFRNKILTSVRGNKATLTIEKVSDKLFKLTIPKPL